MRPEPAVLVAAPPERHTSLRDRRAVPDPLGSDSRSLLPRVRPCLARPPAGCCAARAMSATGAQQPCRLPREEISYAPNRAARSLVTGRSDSVAFFVDETEDRLFSDPFFLGMLRGTQARDRRGGPAAGLHRRRPHRGPPRASCTTPPGGHVDGVLLLSLHGAISCRSSSRSTAADRAQRPPAERRRRRSSSSTPTTVGGAGMATRHLLDTGRRHVATVTGPQDMCAGQDRLAGYVDSLHRARPRAAPGR